MLNDGEISYVILKSLCRRKMKKPMEGVFREIMAESGLTSNQVKAMVQKILYEIVEETSVNS